MEPLDDRLEKLKNNLAAIDREGAATDIEFGCDYNHSFASLVSSDMRRFDSFLNVVVPILPIFMERSDFKGTLIISNLVDACRNGHKLADYVSEKLDKVIDAALPHFSAMLKRGDQGNIAQTVSTMLSACNQYPEKQEKIWDFISPVFPHFDYGK